MALTSRRLKWVDIAKALAIIAIIAASTAYSFASSTTISPSNTDWCNSLVSFVASFGIPTFLVLSGYTMRDGWIRISGLNRLAKEYAIPYIVTGIVMMLMLALLNTQSLVDGLLALLYDTSSSASNMILPKIFGSVTVGILYFLPALIIGKIVASALNGLHPVLRIVIAGFLFVAGSGTACSLLLPFGIQAGLCFSWWIVCGYMMREQKIFESYGWEMQLVCVTTLIGLLYCLSVTIGIIDSPVYEKSLFRNGIVDMIGTTCIAILIMMFARLLSFFPKAIRTPLEMLGRSTLAVFCCYAIILAVISEPVMVLLSKALGTNFIVPLVMFIISIAFSILFAIATRWTPGICLIYHPRLRKPRELGVDERDWQFEEKPELDNEEE